MYIYRQQTDTLRGQHILRKRSCWCPYVVKALGGLCGRPSKGVRQGRQAENSKWNKRQEEEEGIGEKRTIKKGKVLLWHYVFTWMPRWLPRSYVHFGHIAIAQQLNNIMSFWDNWSVWTCVLKYLWCTPVLATTFFAYTSSPIDSPFMAISWSSFVT